MKNFQPFSYFLLFSCTGAINKESIREISQGLLIGKTQRIILFPEGHPFRKPPINELRWKAPQMAMPWKGFLRRRILKMSVFKEKLS